MSYLEQKKIHAISSLNDICYYMHADDGGCTDRCPVRGLTRQIHSLHGIQIRVNDQLEKIVLQ